MTMTTIEFQVIGELKNDPGHFLLLGDDGQCYDYNIALDEIIPIDVDGTWAIDIIGEKPVVIEADASMIAS